MHIVFFSDQKLDFCILVCKVKYLLYTADMKSNRKIKGEELERQMVDELIKELLDWVYKLDDTPAITSNFFSKFKIPWRRFICLKKKYPSLDSAYQEVCTELCVKWFNYGMKSEKLPYHQQKMLEKYLAVYDPHIWNLKNQQYQEMKDKKINESFIERIIPNY